MVVARGPPPERQRDGKAGQADSKDHRKARRAGPAASIGTSISRNKARLSHPSCAASRNRSDGISCQPCSIKTRGQRQVKEHMRQHHPMQPVNAARAEGQRDRADPRASPARPKDLQQSKDGNDHRKDEGRTQQGDQNAPAPAKPPPCQRPRHRDRQQGADDPRTKPPASDRESAAQPSQPGHTQAPACIRLQGHRQRACLGSAPQPADAAPNPGPCGLLAERAQPFGHAPHHAVAAASSGFEQKRFFRA